MIKKKFKQQIVKQTFESFEVVSIVCVDVQKKLSHF